MSAAPPASETRWLFRGFALALALVGVLTVWFESPRWGTAEAREETLSGWLSGTSPDWLPFVPLLCALPLLWRILRRPTPRNARDRWTAATAANDSRPRVSLMVAAGLFLFALMMSRWAGRDLQGLPPAYHDEYSYLLQAQTFLRGRLYTDSFAPQPELFDQMHVLNEGRFASRYFPGAGLWILPFLAIGDPWLGHQLAQAFAAAMLFWIGRELSNNGVGLLAGLLFAVSPGLLLFSNLLLAHQPTLVGLTTFQWAYLKWMRTGSRSTAWIAGVGLAWAMVCRPLTAAGFGLPFGLLFLSWWATGRPGFLAARGGFSERSLTALGLGGPLLLGLLALLATNQRITGSVWVSPYQLYTDLYTPRHVYGFNNAVRGAARGGAKTLENYDRWAENLTPALAARNVAERLVNSLRWSLGVVPLTLGCLAAAGGLLPLWMRRRGAVAAGALDRSGEVAARRAAGWGLVVAAIVSLHLAHVPYWFSGILGWHYVFETAPLWLLLFAEGSRRLTDAWRLAGRVGLVWWWRGLIAAALAVNLVTAPPLWPGRLDRALVEVGFPRQRYARFREEIDQLRRGARVIVFVIPDDSDRHMDYVTNDAGLDGEVLLARLREPGRLQEFRRLFPDRAAFLFDAASREFRRVGEAQR